MCPVQRPHPELARHPANAAHTRSPPVRRRRAASRELTSRTGLPEPSRPQRRPTTPTSSTRHSKIATTRVHLRPSPHHPTTATATAITTANNDDPRDTTRTVTMSLRSWSARLLNSGGCSMSPCLIHSVEPYCSKRLPVVRASNQWPAALGSSADWVQLDESGDGDSSYETMDLHALHRRSRLPAPCGGCHRHSHPPSQVESRGCRSVERTPS